MVGSFRRGLAVALLAVLVAACGAPPESPSATTSFAFTTPVSEPAPSTTARAVQVTPVIAAVVAAPVPVPATDGKLHLAYELQLTNVLDGDVTLTSLTVDGSGTPLLTLTGDRLAYRTRALGAGVAPTATLGPGRAGIVWLDVTLEGGAAIPTELTHTVVVELAKPTPPLLPATITEDDIAPVAVSRDRPADISPPLRGPRWLDGNSCCDMTAHRLAMNPLDGNLWAAERFAIDYVQLSPDGTIYVGAPTAPQSYPYFGADVHAVADGPVVAVLDGLPEQIAGRSPTGLPIEQYAGNHVVQDISGGGTERRYALYAHLQTGSVAVAPGDRLADGQVLGRLGNSGNTDAPHLHFQVMSTPDPLRSNGLPFTFDGFTLDGRLASMAALDPLLTGTPARLAPGSAARSEAGVSPLVLDVMTYANP